jgi:hypothetical protein
VLKELVMPWVRTTRIVAAESSFASVESTEGLYKAGLIFVEVFKTATRRYSMPELSWNKFGSRSDCIDLLSLNEAKEPWNMAST